MGCSPDLEEPRAAVSDGARNPPFDRPRSRRPWAPTIPAPVALRDPPRPSQSAWIVPGRPAYGLVETLETLETVETVDTADTADTVETVDTADTVETVDTAGACPYARRIGTQTLRAGGLKCGRS